MTPAEIAAARTIIAKRQVTAVGQLLTAALDEVARLTEELGHATANDGDWLSKTSRAMVEKFSGDRDKLRQDNRALRGALNEALDLAMQDAPARLFDTERIAELRTLVGKL